VDLDGDPAAFRLLRHHGDWMAYSEDEQVRIWMDGRGMGGFPLEGLELVMITDATPYIEGTRAMWRKKGWMG
jgi:hypothetical protein